MSIASASEDKTVQVWDASSGHNFFSYSNHTDIVTDVAWSPDGNYIASASADKTVQVWDAATGHILHANFVHEAVVGSLAWSRDSTYIVTGDYDSDDSVRIWNVSQKSYQQLFKGTSNQQIYAVSWWPNDKYIAAGGQDEKVKVWDATTEKLALIYTDHNQPIMSVQWSHDGKSIVSSALSSFI